MPELYKVLDIRGTHGSGKSHIPHQLLQMYDHTSIMGHPLTYDGPFGVLGYYIKELHLCIVGRYETACGGCDGIKTQDEIKARIEAWRPTCNILLEGILVAHTFGPWLNFSRGKNWHFCFLDTSLEKCIERVNHRRALSGKGALADPGNIVRDWHRIRGLNPKFHSAGARTHWLRSEHSIADFLKVLADEPHRA